MSVSVFRNLGMTYLGPMAQDLLRGFNWSVNWACSDLESWLGKDLVPNSLNLVVDSSQLMCYHNKGLSFLLLIGQRLPFIPCEVGFLIRQLTTRWLALLEQASDERERERCSTTFQFSKNKAVFSSIKWGHDTFLENNIM